jgi:hypothetical protein
LPGGKPPETPRPPAAGGPRPLAQARQGSHRTRGTLRAHGFNPVQARSPRAIMSAGCRLRGGLQGRCGGPRLARRPGAARAGTPAWCPSCGPSRHRFWHPGPCLGPRAPGKRRRQPRSLRCAPPNGGRLRRGVDAVARQGQRLGVAAARCAPGALFHPLIPEAGARSSTASQQGGRAAPLGPPARMVRGATPGLSPLGPGGGFARRGTATGTALIFARVRRAPAQRVRDSPSCGLGGLAPGAARAGQIAERPHAPEPGSVLARRCGGPRIEPHAPQRGPIGQLAAGRGVDLPDGGPAGRIREAAVMGPGLAPPVGNDRRQDLMHQRQATRRGFRAGPARATDAGE